MLILLSIYIIYYNIIFIYIKKNKVFDNTSFFLVLFLFCGGRASDSRTDRKQKRPRRSGDLFSKKLFENLSESRLQHLPRNCLVRHAEFSSLGFHLLDGIVVKAQRYHPHALAPGRKGRLRPCGKFGHPLVINADVTL